MKTYKLKTEPFGGYVEVTADELRRVLVEEGAEILFGMSFDSIFALRRQYDLRGGPAAITPETVRTTFANLLQDPRHLPGARVTLSGGRPDAVYEVDLDLLKVAVVGSTMCGDEIRTYSHTDSARAFETAMRPERRCATAPRRRAWDGFSSGKWWERRVGSSKVGRRAGDHLERRQPSSMPRRRLVDDRRISRIVCMATWAHWCEADFKRLTVLSSPHCPLCGQGRFQGVERRRLANRRNPFIHGRRREDA